jgi:hypothetical protein
VERVSGCFIVKNGRPLSFSLPYSLTTSKSKHFRAAMSNASFDNKVVSKHDLLNKALLPEDSYLDGVYWADLPSRERSAWVNSQVSKETIRELRVVGRMVKEDPLSPISVYFSKYVTTGMVSIFLVLIQAA